MNLILGKITDSSKTKEQIEMLGELISKAKHGKKLSTGQVISACDALSKSLSDDRHIPLLMSLGMTEKRAKAELNIVKQVLSRGYLESRVEIELGQLKRSFIPKGSSTMVTQEIKPLGVLFHIAAGNADALPAFSVIEGLLTGNINILKLPGADNGISITILRELMEYEPLILDYVMVFDSPSQDLEAMQKMADKADGIVVWGGDDAVKAVRRMARPDTRIIEWGHKISFAYVSGNSISDDELQGIAFNICDTNQLFCNSCQGIYLDEEDSDSLIRFGKRFLAILDEMAKKIPYNQNPYTDAQKTLEIYTEELEAVRKNKQILRTANCSVIVEKDSQLKPSYMFRNCWIKPLPREKLLDRLLEYKNHLQTVALVCDDNSKAGFEELFCKTGIVRITSGENMSLNYCGIPHDGEFSLKKYTKIVSFEY